VLDDPPVSGMCSEYERRMYFPKGSDEIPENKLKSVWEERYLKYPELKK